MTDKEKKICGQNPKDERCDVVEYAQQLVDKDEAAPRARMTEGQQKGYTKASVDEVVKAGK